MQNSVDLNVNLQALVHFEVDAWVAWCPALDVASQGDTQDDALRSLKEAVEGWFESCLQRGVLKEALLECGFTRVGPGKQPDSHNSVFLKDCNRDAVEKPLNVSVPAYIAAAELLGVNHAAN